MTLEELRTLFYKALQDEDHAKIYEISKEILAYKASHPEEFSEDEDEEEEDEEDEDEEEEEEEEEEEGRHMSWEDRAWKDSGMTWSDFYESI